ncbi:MAG: enoyl-CoA hydratase-related protein [Dehalococcoidia bacterium]|nr:enoyl-CoA hydratase-related protein [Dehalococcoidia bacterium]
MTYNNLLYEKSEGIGTVTINRRIALNALNSEVLTELYQIFGELESDPEVRVVIITGTGEKAFVAGADIAEMQTLDAVGIRKFAVKGRKICDKIYNFSKPVIAAVNGFALGGGCELTMCCDLRIASENARFGQPEINLGIIPGFGGTQRLPRLIGMTKAKELVYTGDMIDAQTALALGLVNKVVPQASLMTEARELARKLLSKSGATLAQAKRAMNTGANMDLSSALDLEEECLTVCFATEDQKEGMKAFLEKRKPQFKHR